MAKDESGDTLHYKRRLYAVQVQLVKLQRALIADGTRVLVIVVYVVKVFGTIRAAEQVTLPARCHHYATRKFSRLRRASVSRLMRARRSTIAVCRPS
jgi:hypothetical protein